MYKGVNPTPRNWALVTTASGRLRVCDSGGRVIAGKWTQMRIGKTKNGHVDDHPKRGIVDWVLATPHHLSQTSPQKAAGSYCVFSTPSLPLFWRCAAWDRHSMRLASLTTSFEPSGLINWNLEVPGNWVPAYAASRTFTRAPATGSHSLNLVNPDIQPRRQFPDVGRQSSQTFLVPLPRNGPPITP
ncbi:hypothetical protein BDZ45DRAFT_692590 [Acephala macrosclerotiorum]|nr:hypothetical protein BDZ45DRAFT_692590 [Acephala macrosclerotiorum]